ncbi:hypothetical protein AS156_36030 [Bradyrhizobium macuxiense]|uniref:Uncharacterized protein n=1 Tax=Bradyrhizobium macuxiense TaxID=1755647 RepID=A0A109JZV5_9BRAD|nr:hypothetical protein [Bradyrhizobium macuxiense]KWV58211.1 hypothetical protein AS156_36030 [Bradyrhizobium macuxiense]
MTLRVFREVGGSRVLVTPTERFPKELDPRLWRLDATGYPDNAVAARVRRDGPVYGRLVKDNRK